MQTMTRSKRMQPVQHVAQGREQDAMYKLGQSQQFLDAQKAKLEELRAYRDQYANDFALSGENGVSATRVQDYRIFLGRLGEAVRQQEALIAQCEAQHEQTRQQWVASRSHNQAIGKVIQRYQAEENIVEERREQQEQDERSQRKPKK